jgi:hypothetical protein
LSLRKINPARRTLALERENSEHSLNGTPRFACGVLARR